METPGMMQRLFSAAVCGLLVVVLYGSARLWFFAILRVLRGEAIVPFEPRRPVPWGLLDLLLIFLLTLFTVRGATLVAVQWWQIPLPEEVDKISPQQFAILMLANSLALLASCLAAISLVQLRAGASRNDLGLIVAHIWSDVKLGAKAFLMLAPPMYLLQIGLTQIWKYEHSVQDLLRRQTDLTMLAVTLTTAVGVAPLAEEMFFRVLLQGWLENASVLARKSLRLTFGTRAVESDDVQRDWLAAMMGDKTGEAFLETPANWQTSTASASAPPIDDPRQKVDDGNPYAPPRTATAGSSTDINAHAKPTKSTTRLFWPGYVPVVVSAAIFALLHLGQGPAPIPLFFLAIGLGYLYRQTHRATPPIVVHLLINSVSMTALWLSLVFKP